MSHQSNQTQTRAALLQNTISILEDPIPVLIHPLNSQNLRQIQTTNSDIVAVTYEGSIQFHTRGSLEAPPRTLSFPIKFKQIACGSACVIMLSHQGQVYSYGEDPQKFGLMCQEAQYSIKLPTRVEALEEIMITQISVGTSHAAAIDISGQLYTWGTGEFGQLGTQKISKGVNVVESARIFTVKQVECGDTFTCLCTRGGYAYIYGTLGGHYNRNRLTGDTLMKRLIQTQAVNRSMQSPKRESASNQPLTIQSLSQHFVNYIAAGLNFVCVLTDTGSVYVFDDCLELVRLPISGDTTMQSIAVCGDIVYGITKNHRYLYKWGSPSLDPSENLGSARKQCQLFSWPGSVFELGAMYKEECHIFGSYKGWAAILFESREIEAQAIGEYLSHIEPYKRATFSMNPVESVYDSLDVNSFTLKMPSLDRSFISTVHSRRSQSPELITQIELESLLNDDMPFEKMLSIRMEFEQRQYLTKAFVPLFYPLLEGAFDKIRNYSNQVRIYQRSIAQTFMPNVISKVFTNYRSYWRSEVFYLLVEQFQSNISDTERFTRTLQRVFNRIRQKFYREASFSIINSFRDARYSKLQAKSKMMVIRSVIQRVCLKTIKQAFNQCKIFNNAHQSNQTHMPYAKTREHRTIQKLNKFHKFLTHKTLRLIGAK